MAKFASDPIGVNDEEVKPHVAFFTIYLPTYYFEITSFINKSFIYSSRAYLNYHYLNLSFDPIEAPPLKRGRPTVRSLN